MNLLNLPSLIRTPTEIAGYSEASTMRLSNILDSRALQVAVANRNLLPQSQAIATYKELYWDISQCRGDSGMERFNNDVSTVLAKAYCLL